MLCMTSILLLLNDNDKFNDIYMRYGKLMLYKANEILRDYSLSEDAISEAFIRIYKNLHKLDDFVPSARTASFVTMVVRNVALTMLKRQKNMRELPLDEELRDNRALDDTVVSNMTADEIMKVVDSLGEELRNVFILYYAYEMNHKEISATLGITANLAAVRLHRAKRKLAAILSERGGFDK